LQPKRNKKLLLIPVPSQFAPENQRFTEDTGATSSVIFEQDNPRVPDSYTRTYPARNAVRFTILASGIAPAVNQ
jgi:hypothetical protein